MSKPTQTDRALQNAARHDKGISEILRKRRSRQDSQIILGAILAAFLISLGCAVYAHLCTPPEPPPAPLTQGEGLHL